MSWAHSPPRLISPSACPKDTPPAPATWGWLSLTGSTSWAGYMANTIMGDEVGARRDFYFYQDARNPLDILGWLQQYMAMGAPAHIRAKHMLDFTMHGKAFAREALQNTAEV